MFNVFQDNPDQNLSFLDKLEIEVSKKHLMELSGDFNREFEAWANINGLNKPDQLLLMSDFLPSLLADVLNDGFYNVLYRQAIYWLEAGETQNSAYRLMNQLRAQMLEMADESDNASLAAALVNLFQIGNAMVRVVYAISKALMQVKYQSATDIRRLKHCYHGTSFVQAEALLEVCVQHQNWKTAAFELALGRQKTLESFEPDYHKCKIAQWLENKGETLIPERDLLSFKVAHKKVHLLGVMAIEASRNNRCRDIVALLQEMERNSQIVLDILFDIVEREFVGNQNDASLKGFLNGELLDIEVERAEAFASRHDFWLDMIVIGLGEYTASQAVVQHIAKAIKLIARTEDMLFFVEDKAQFVILSLGKETEGAHIFANRVYQSIEHDKVTLEDGTQVKLDVPCGALSYWGGLGLPSGEVMQALMHQLALAEESPKATVKYKVLDVIKNPMQDVNEKLL